MAINLGRSEGVRDRPLAARVVILGARSPSAYRTDSASRGAFSRFGPMRIAALGSLRKAQVTDPVVPLKRRLSTPPWRYL